MPVRAAPNFGWEPWVVPHETGDNAADFQSEGECGGIHGV